MRKKRSDLLLDDIVLLSSESDNDNERRPYSDVKQLRKSKLPATSTNPRPIKKRRVGLRHESSLADEIKLSFEDFNDVCSGFKVSTTGSRNSHTKELWIDKYKPHSLEELAVHKKKVHEVKTWFEERLQMSKDESGNRVLIITGQAGVGKSATVHVIASELGARLCEWNTPIPTVWQEHLHNSSTGIQYTSKLDEFENFLEKVRKYGLLPTSFEGSTSTAILVIDDLPVTNGRMAFERLKNCLRLLVKSARIPTAVVLTDYGKSDTGDLNSRYLEELQRSLEDAGACKVSFNPITTNSIKKTLSRISRQENCTVTAENTDQIAEASGGDIRSAITSLQLFCLNLDSVLNLSLSNPPPTPNPVKQKVDTHQGISLQFGKDETLSLFHCLGKFLHNKRETENVIAMDQDAFLVREELSRLPLKMDAPEKILCQAHGQARPIADFLHENVLDFINEEAIGDAWSVASYLSDADLLLGSSQGTSARFNDYENVIQSAAASVAVRGVLFGNSHPLPPRWHAIRRPNLWQVERSSSHNKHEMSKQRFDTFNGFSSYDATVTATEYAPALKWLGCRAFRECELDPLSLQCKGTDNLGEFCLEKQENDDQISDDEIEDC